MSKKYNVAIIGSGAIANKFHIPAFKKNKRINDVILFDINKKNLLKSSKINKIKSVYSNFDKMISEKKIDIIVDVNLGKKEFTAFTMDLTKKYIEINASYRS